MENDDAPNMDEYLCKFMMKAKDLSVFYKMTCKNGEMVATLKKLVPPKHGQNLVIWGLQKGTKVDDMIRFALQAGQVFEVRLHLSETEPVTENSYCSITYVLPDIAKQAFKRLNGTSLNDRLVVTKLAEGMRLELLSVVSQIHEDDSPDFMPRFNNSSLSTIQENLIERPVTFDESPTMNYFDPDDPRCSPLISPVHYPYMLNDNDPPYLWQRHIYRDTVQSQTSASSDDAYMLCPGGMMVFPNAPWSRKQKPSLKWAFTTSHVVEWTLESLETKASSKNPFLTQNYNFGQLPYAVPDATYLQDWVFGYFTEWNLYGCRSCGFLMGPYF
ncbi:unnamed protein product [Callosobruchus maculatus]|uniref:RRM domain-containing protein n=1 Tax=Callosobruchus maculatus TaxID=64391 RepID=A0A653CWD3_CALMS|nr:unnamed protein product [Callosobruchus maculatus]